MVETSLCPSNSCRVKAPLTRLNVPDVFRDNVEAAILGSVFRRRSLSISRDPGHQLCRRMTRSKLVSMVRGKRLQTLCPPHAAQVSGASSLSSQYKGPHH